LAGEATKLKHTATFWLSLIVPTAVVLALLLGLLEGYVHQHVPRMSRPLWDEWSNTLRGPWTIWTAAVMPIMVAVEAAGLASLEHSGNHWKQLFALPIPRWTVFAVKISMCCILTGASSLVFSGGVVVLALLRSGLFHLHLASAVPWSFIVSITAKTYLASWCVIGIQTWLSMRFSGFAIPLGTALGATLFGGAVGQLGIVGWYPWRLPLESLPWGQTGAAMSVVVSLGLFLAVALLAGRNLSRREIV
jgi:ABC-2 type transport system permease protein